MIKSLFDALASGNAVRAVIRNTATNCSGWTPGITMPSRITQEKLLLKVYRDVGSDLRDTPLMR
jgi:acyl transferase domain-containing protein